MTDRHNIDRNRISIFEIYSDKEKQRILICCSMVAFLTPFTEAIYLPVLTQVKESLNATETEVTATVSLYMAAVAVGLLVWGPLSDSFGRRPILFFGLALFEMITVACMFAPDVKWLIALRVLEGFIVGNCALYNNTL